ncbi:MAG: hypothetical protein GF408_07645 [Candidatus Omnitrophica bacterium]|nr:hypothetical protein [Candidatus Omnitrophota bacterium]
MQKGAQDKLKRTLECDLPRLSKYSREYSFWWRIQVISLFSFVILLVFGVMGDWWLLVPGFICLALNMFANLNRMMVFRKVARSAEKRE